MSDDHWYHHINWTNWFTAALGGGWAIYLMYAIGSDPSVKDVLTVGILFFVSVVLLETKVRKV